MRQPATPGTIHDLLARHGLAARKALGQHFLASQSALARIAAAADLTPADTVLEVGPGLGGLTRELLAASAKVIAIEKDAGFVRLLRVELPDEKLHLFEADILDLRIDTLLEESGVAGPYKVVANLPYNVGTAIVRHFLESPRPPQLLIVLLQKEVAENMCAVPSEMSTLSVATQLFATPRIVGLVKAGCFVPPPKVESAILRLDIRLTPLLASSETHAFFRLVHAGFSSPRKQLLNNLSAGLHLTRESTTAALTQSGIAPTRRAETISLPEWLALHRLLQELAYAL